MNRKVRRPGRPGSVRLAGEIEKLRDRFLSENLGREEFDDSVVQRTLGEELRPFKKEEVLETMPKRKVEIEHDIKEPIYTWAFQSSRPIGGQVVNYETRLNHDGTLSCNCLGWRFVKDGKPRSCKHTKRVDTEAKQVMKMYKAGETLPVLEPLGEASTGPTLSTLTPSTTKIRHGRLIEI
jgi:hypothetical protein